MAQTKEGALKAAAGRSGLTLAAYKARLASGERMCTRCKTWRLFSDFGRDRTRPDGRDRTCFCCRRVKERQNTKGRTSTFKGRRHTKEARAAMSAAHKGIPSKRRGTKLPDETRAKISATLRRTAARGDRAPGYIDGKGAERRGQRLTIEAKRWRYDVMLRDGFICVHCGDDRGGNLCAHHIWSWADYPDLRFVVGNGVTLCEGCHWLVHHYGLQLWSVV